MNPSMHIGYVVVSYPELSETFIQREIESLSRLGIHVTVYPLISFGKKKILSPTLTINPVTHFGLITLIFAAIINGILHLPLVWGALKRFFRNIPRTGENFLLNLWAATYALGRKNTFRADKILHFHGAWATGPATVAWSAARLLNKKFSFAAHAYDIYRNGGDAFLKEKIKHAIFVHTSTQTNVNYLNYFTDVPAKIVLARNGLQHLPCWHSDKPFHEPLELLCVGRLVPKKGQFYQLQLAQDLKQQGVSFRLRIAGGGPLKQSLQQIIDQQNLANHVFLLGAQPQEEIQRLYTEADIFLHTGIIDAQGDRDGLPNVVPEAMAHGLVVISGSDSGVREAVKHEQTGLVTDLSIKDELVQAVRRIMEDQALRQTIRHNARQWVEENFLAENNAAILAQAFLENREK